MNYLSKGIFVFLFLFSIQWISAQDKDPNQFFNNKPLMPIGGYYYPEHWDASKWERDIKKMSQLGFEFTHIGEFAWAFMEPEEGKFTFDWLDKSLALCQKYGVKVILCTPTPTPPAWMSIKYPEILIENEEGLKAQHGSRLHPSWSSSKYRFFTERIVNELGKRYGNHPAVIGWQLDNEPSHAGWHYDYSTEAQRAFKIWLQAKYKNIDTLNKAWGNPFWSGMYQRFDQVLIPRAKLQPAGANPHAELDFKRFSADQLADFLGFQTNILRKNISSKQYITTNFAYTTFLPEVDPYRLRNKLDFSSYTMYLLSTYLDSPTGPLAHRLGSGLGMSYMNEFTKSVQGYTGIMELQPGQINWGSYNSQPLPGAVKMWIWHNFALGAKFVCTYRFDRPIYGGEQFHYGILSTDNQTVDLGGKEYVEAIQELKTLQKSYDPKAKAPVEYESRRMAFLWSHDNLLETQMQAQTTQWNTYKHYQKYYDRLKRMGSPVSFVTEDQKWDVKKYPFMLAMAYQQMDAALIAKMKIYAQEGGHLIFTCRSGIKNRNGHLWDAPYAEPIKNLIGAQVKFFDHLPDNIKGKVGIQEVSYSWNNWADILEPLKGTEIWAQYQDQFYQGKPSVTHLKVGKGSVTYIGVDTDEGDLEEAVLRKVYQLNQTSVLKQPSYFFTEWRDGFWVSVNYTSENVEAPISANQKILIGEKTVKPGGFVVWK